MDTTTRRQFKSRMDRKQDVTRAIPALMGDGNGTVEVPGQPGYVYIRVGDGDLGQAFNNRCPLYDNLAVYVGYDPVTDPDRRIFQVLSVRMTDYANAGNTPIAQVANHHARHEFGGGDDVYVDWRRLLGFRVGRPAGFVVTVDQGVMMRAGAWTAIVSQTVDLTAAKPGGVNSARYVLVALDSAGTITTSSGAIVSAALLDISNCPVPAAGEVPLAAVRLYSSQSQIDDKPSAPDIIDLRFPQTYVTAGSNIFGSGVANRLAYWSAADTLTSNAEMQHQTNVAIYATKSLTVLAPATYYLGLQSYCTATIAADQSGTLVAVGSNIVAGGAANYTGALQGFVGVFDFAGAGSVTEVDGYNYTLEVSAAGTLDTARLFHAQMDAGAAGTITLGYGVHLEECLGSVGTYYGVYVETGAAAAAQWAFYSEGDKITTKGAAAAGIELDANAATGNFTLSLSPANLTGSHRVTFGDVTGTNALGAGTLTNATANDVTVANHTHAITGAFAPSLHNVLDSTYHGDVLTGAITRGDLLYGNATPKIARLALGGAAGSFVTRDANDVLWSGFYFSGTAAQTYTFPAAGGTVAMLNAANAFTNSNTIASGKFLTCLTDGNTGGLRAGSGSDVLWYRGAADTWRTPDKVIIESDFTAGQDDLNFNWLYGTTSFMIGAGVGAIFDPDSGNWKIAGTATRATTEGTNHLDIFNGTAPVGTLANGISLYSASGVPYMMNAAGNGSAIAGLAYINVFTADQSITLSANASLSMDVTNANAGASAAAGYYAISDTVNASFRAFSAASGGGARLNLVASGGYILLGTTTNHKVEFYMNNVLTMSLPTTGGVKVAGAFGCNAAAAQTAYASGGALAAYGAGANGLDTAAHMQALYNLVVAIRAALVANGIMS